MNFQNSITVVITVLILLWKIKLTQLACLPCQRGDPPPGQYIETDGKKSKCWNNDECYSMREPKQWCHLLMDSFTL